MNWLKDYWFLFNGILFPVLGYMYGKYTAAKTLNRDAIEAIKYLLQSTLYKSCEEYRKKGCCAYNAKQTLLNCYTSYHKLGGDSFITDMVNSCLDLPDIDE
jgi:stalled ribosome alternative rescue factor ArfA